MRDYNNLMEDDYYEEEGEEEYEEEEEEEEEEEVKPREPTKEELEYLQLRQMLKEPIRKQMKKENSGTSRSDSNDRRKTKLPNVNFGSFFGPSQPVIAQRVIQESKSLLENQHLASRISNPIHIKKKNQNKVCNGGSKSSLHKPPPKVSGVKAKSQNLKDTRDYSFLLSDDAELPAPSKAPPPRNVPIRNSEGRPAQAPLRSKQPSSNGGKQFHASHGERKLGSVAGQLAHKSGSSYRASSTSKPSSTSADSRKQLGNNSGNGPGRPAVPKGLPPKMPASNTGNRSSTPGIKNPVNGVHKSVPSKAHSSIPRQSVVPPKVHSSIPKQSVEQRRDIRQPNKPIMIPKQPVASSKSQISKPLKQISRHTASQDHRPKNKVPRRHPDDVEDEMDISSMIRSMFNYNPKRIADVDEDDDNMEAGFDEIMREERRSSMIARREDEEQLRLIEEEEKRERERRKRLKSR